MGRFWVDLGSAVLRGLPPTAYVRKDAQSDHLHALTCNPFYFVSSSTGDWDMMKVCWGSKGALLYSLTGALCAASSMHTRMTASERLECAVSGFCLLDLWQLLAAKKEADAGVRVGSMSFAHTPVTHLQNTCLSMIVALFTKGDACTGLRGDG